jgi:hypothetical protein
MIKPFALLLIITMLTGVAWAQNTGITEDDNLQFTLVKNLGPDKTVYFHIDGLKDEDHKQAILERLLMDPGISDGRIFKTPKQADRCQLYMAHEIDAAYVRSILLELDVDYDFTTVSINGHLEEQNLQAQEKQGNSPSTPVLIEGFPTYKDTGNPEADKADYARRKKAWIEANPEKYQEYLDGLR